MAPGWGGCSRTRATRRAGGHAMGGGYMHVLPSAWSGDSISGGRIRRAKMERAIAGRISWGFAAPCSRGQGLFRSDLLREACRAARPIVCGRGRVEDGSRARAHPRRSSLAFVLLHVHELPRAQRAQRAHSDTAGRRSSACVRAVCSGSGCSTQARLRFRLPSAQRPTFLSPPPRPPLRRRQAPPPRPPLPLCGRPPSLLFFGPAKHCNCNCNSTLDQQKPLTYVTRTRVVRVSV